VSVLLVLLKRERTYSCVRIVSVIEEREDLLLCSYS
jgi:hypothetical protein